MTAHAAPPPRPNTVTTAEPDGPHRAPLEVTLITGDKVTMYQTPRRTAPSVDVRRPPGAQGSVRIATEDGDTYVYPDDAVPYIATGRLDKQLFNVTQLAAQGYDDAHSEALPLILTHTKNSPALKRGVTPQPPGPPDATLPGAETTLRLPSVHGEAVRTSRSEAAAFWSALTGGGPDAGRPSAGRTADVPDTSGAPPRFTADVDRVWLDSKAQATLADTTAQIGAPDAWAAGGTGTGVRVAVLDSGVDTTHPDLADRIVASRSFVPGEDVVDRNGHGTHTASTAVGTGAASGGKERGVAPDADLLVAKVLGDSGSGAVSGIIAGMEWAARAQHAKVISMSLGVSGWHTQDDPMSQAVNRLSAETGALFVVAAGNDGPGPHSLAAPGTADAALTVGAVDSADRLAEFSSAGPRMNDDALKPDLTAPGVDVLAARSQYMSWGEGYYHSNSGTSMATPHVAGAAAVLAQKHPQWTGRQIKDTLMSTSVPTPRFTPYQAGTGRLDVAAAYRHDQVVATGSVDAGLVPWPPSTRPQPIEREITYTNTTDRPVELRLSVAGGDSPAEVFTTVTDHVTVPARGTSTVGIVVDPKGLAAGQYTAQVTARHATGAVHTAVGISVESEKHDLTIDLKDRAGRPVSGEVEITSADGRSTFLWIPDGKHTSRWAPGTYMVHSLMDVQGTHGRHSLGLAVLTAPEVDLTTDRHVNLDASRARQVKVATSHPTTVVHSRIDLYRSFTSSTPTPSDGSALRERIRPSATYDSLWALPTRDKVTKGSFVLATRIRAEQPPLQVNAPGFHLEDPVVQPGSRPMTDGTSRLDAVFAGTGSPAEYAGLSVRGKAVVVRSSDAVAPTDQAAAAHGAGAALLLVVNDGIGRRSDWYGSPDGVSAGPIPVASTTKDQGSELIKKIAAAHKHTFRLAVEAHPAPKYLYDLVDHHVGRVPEDPSATTDPRRLARIDLDFAPPPGRQVTESRLDFPVYDYPPYKGMSPNALPVEAVAPGRRTDWVSAGSGITWQQSAALDGWGHSQTDQLTYRPGSVHKDRWFGPITRPRLIGNEIPFRGENALSAYIQGFGDAGSAHSGGSGMYQAISFYQGDRQLTKVEGWPTLSVGDLAPEKRAYRLVVDTEHDGTISPYSTRTRTEWSFTSGAAEGVQAVPLVQLDYETVLDSEGRAKRTGRFAITPVVLGSDAPHDAPSSLGLEISYDDGATWQRQGLKEKQGTWRVSLNAPHRADYVSIRVTAKQRNGGGVVQTVVRAFGLR
ncbi:S8 family serine peptidase [Streptomyces sp. NPDC005908]|uniref:S8 family peptidase n=1 Tax=Streptomyces sp. NPDC005908 TaxID=3157084 RepID=UPI00340B347D